MLTDDLDIDDVYDGKSYAKPQIFIQMGKILDSRDNPYPVNTVTTDDGYTYEISFDQAELIIDAIRLTPSNTRRILIDSIQNSKGFEAVMAVVCDQYYE